MPVVLRFDTTACDVHEMPDIPETEPFCHTLLNFEADTTPMALYREKNRGGGRWQLVIGTNRMSDNYIGLRYVVRVYPLPGLTEYHCSNALRMFLLLKEKSCYDRRSSTLKHGHTGTILPEAISGVLSILITSFLNGVRNRWKGEGFAVNIFFQSTDDYGDNTEFCGTCILVEFTPSPADQYKFEILIGGETPKVPTKRPPDRNCSTSLLLLLEINQFAGQHCVN